MRLTLRKFIRITLILGFLALLLLEVALNAFLNSGWLLRQLNKHPERLRMDYAWAAAAWPGKVWLRGWSLRVQDSRLSWSLELEEATVSFSVEALFSRIFLASSVEGRGLTARLTPLPPAPSPAGKGEPEKVNAPSGKEPWIIELDAIRIENFQELLLDPYAFRGRARLGLSLFLRPKQRLQLQGISLSAEGIDVFQGEGKVASHLQAELHGLLLPFTPGKVKGLEFLRFVQAQGLIRAEVEDLRFLEYYLKRAPWLRLAGGAGHLEADLRIDRGQFLEGNCVEILSKRIRAEVPDYSIEGSGHVDWRVDANEASIETSFQDYSMRREGDAQPHVRGKNLTLRARSPDLSIFEPFDELIAEMDEPSAEIPDIRVYNGYLPESLGLELEGGAGQLQSHFQANAQSQAIDGRMELSARKVRARYGDWRLTGRWRLKTRMVSGSLDTQEFDLSGSQFWMEGVSVTDLKGEEAKTEGWWAHATLIRGKLTPRAHSMLSARLQIEMRDVQPLIKLYSSKKELPGWIKKLFGQKQLKASARLEVGRDWLELDRFRLTAKNIEVRARLKIVRGKTRGILYAKYGILSIGMDLKDGETDMKFLKPGKWFDAYPPF